MLLFWIKTTFLLEIGFLDNFKSNQIKFICDKNKHNVTHKKQSRYVDRTQRQHTTALTSAFLNSDANDLKIWTYLQK